MTSSPDASEEFLTPDSDILAVLSPLSGIFETENSSPEDKEDSHEASKQQEFPFDAAQNFDIQEEEEVVQFITKGHTQGLEHSLSQLIPTFGNLPHFDLHSSSSSLVLSHP
uniref:Uncharacterized protein n=1 Tax=Sphaerodactylus townsendi TaxID=933632 RepID=A0ACB8ECT0_9SAUR